MKTSIRDLSMRLDVIREDDSACVQLFWKYTDIHPFYTTSVKDPENLTVEEVETIHEAVNLHRTFL